MILELLNFPAKASIVGELARKFKSSKIKDYKSLALAKKKPYFFVEEEGSKRLFQIPNAVPSQYIRKLLAFKIGEWLKWDWRIYLGIEELKATEKKLEGKLVYQIFALNEEIICEAL